MRVLDTHKRPRRRKSGLGPHDEIFTPRDAISLVAASASVNLTSFITPDSPQSSVADVRSSNAGSPSGSLLESSRGGGLNSLLALSTEEDDEYRDPSHCFNLLKKAKAASQGLLVIQGQEAKTSTLGAAIDEALEFQSWAIIRNAIDAGTHAKSKTMKETQILSARNKVFKDPSPSRTLNSYMAKKRASMQHLGDQANNPIVSITTPNDFELGVSNELGSPEIVIDVIGSSVRTDGSSRSSFFVRSMSTGTTGSMDGCESPKWMQSVSDHRPLGTQSPTQAPMDGSTVSTVAGTLSPRGGSPRERELSRGSVSIGGNSSPNASQIEEIPVDAMYLIMCEQQKAKPVRSFAKMLREFRADVDDEGHPLDTSLRVASRDLLKKCYNRQNQYLFRHGLASRFRFSEGAEFDLASESSLVSTPLTSADEGFAAASGSNNKGMEAFVDQPPNHRVEVVDCAPFCLGPNGILPVLDLVLHFPNMSYLSLRGSGVEDNTVEYLCLTVTTHRMAQLRVMDLGENPKITFVGGCALQKSVCEAQFLRDVLLDGTSVRGSTLRSIQHRLRSNRKAEERARIAHVLSGQISPKMADSVSGGGSNLISPTGVTPKADGQA